MAIPALVLLAALASVAPQAPAPPAPMELSFGRAAVKAGETAALPIYLVSETNYDQRFQIILEYSEDRLTFQKVEADYLAQRAKWTITGKVSPHPEEPERRILQIDITPGASSFFPSGLVAHAHFAVSKDAADGDIVLAAALIAPLGSKPVASSESAKVTVFTTPVFACFFYMH